MQLRKESWFAPDIDISEKERIPREGCAVFWTQVPHNLDCVTESRSVDANDVGWSN